VTERKRGRPRKFGQIVSLRLEPDLHDALLRKAARQRVEFSDLLRRSLRSTLTESELRISKIDAPVQVPHTAPTSTHD
jgi:hypothetical protein